MKILEFGGWTIAAIFLLTFGSAGCGWLLYDTFAPKYAATERKIFTESQSYNEGMVRDLENLVLQYHNATPEQKDALKATIMHRFSVYPEDRLPEDLLHFYKGLRQ